MSSGRKIRPDAIHDFFLVSKKHPSDDSIAGKNLRCVRITLSQLFLEDSTEHISLTNEQMELIQTASKLNEEQFAALLSFLQKL